MCMCICLATNQDNSDDEACFSNKNHMDHERQVQRINKQPTEDNRSSRNRYALQFFQESKEELRKRKEQAFKSIKPVSLKAQEISDNYFPSGIDMPKRPAWNFSMTKEQLEMKEQRYFTVCNCNSAADSNLVVIIGQHVVII